MVRRRIHPLIKEGLLEDEHMVLELSDEVSLLEDEHMVLELSDEVR